MGFTPTTPETKSVAVAEPVTKILDKYRLRRVILNFDDGVEAKASISYDRGYEVDGVFQSCEHHFGSATSPKHAAEIEAVYDEAAIWDLLAQCSDLGDGTVD